MRICIPTNGDKGLKEKVYDHFGSAPFFTIYDTETKSIEVFNNTNDHSSHGSCQSMAVVSKYNVQAIMTGGMGMRAIQLLNENGVKVYSLGGNTVEEAIKKFEANELIEFTYDNACAAHGHHH